MPSIYLTCAINYEIYRIIDLLWTLCKFEDISNFKIKYTNIEFYGKQKKKKILRENKRSEQNMTMKERAKDNWHFK